MNWCTGISSTAVTPRSLEVLDDRLAGQARVGAAQVLGHVGVAHGEALDVGLVDDRLVPGDAGRPVVAPVEERVDHDRPGHERRAVGRVGGAVGTAVGCEVERRVVPLHLALDRLGVGVDQQLGRVGPQALLGLPRAVHPEAVALARLHPRHVAVVDEGGDLREDEPLLGAVVVEQAELDLLGDLGEQREVRAVAVVGRPQRERLAGPEVHGRSSLGGRSRSLSEPAAGPGRVRPDAAASVGPGSG